MVATAAPALGFGFLNRTEGDSVASIEPGYSFKATVDRTLVACFARIERSGYVTRTVMEIQDNARGFSKKDVLSLIVNRPDGQKAYAVSAGVVGDLSIVR